MADVALEVRLDELFASAPEAFIATRDALVRDLKASGQTEAATRVKALRRPTVAVAAINQLSRSHPEWLATLVAISDDLAKHQADPDADRDEQRELTRQRRQLLQQLTDDAAGTTARPDGSRASIAATLDAASLDDDLRDDLLRGRLAHELSAATRFVGDDGAPSSRAAPRQAAPLTRTAAVPRDELAARRAQAELETVRVRAGATERSMREHDDMATDAADRLEAAHRHVADLEAALADARAALVDAKRAERDAQRLARRARTEHERVTSALRAAERVADDATRGSDGNRD